MAARGAVRVSITADNSGLERGLRGAESDLKHLDDRGSRSLHGLKVAALAAGAAITTGVVIGLKQSVDAAIEAEKSQARMEAQLKAVGISYKQHADQIEQVIQKTSQLAGLDDEDLQDAFTNVVRSTGSVNKSLKQMTLVADLARAKHLDVAKAGEIVGKVMAGNTGVLSRYGITLKDGATATEALGVLHQKFSGQAEAYGKTTAGAQDRFRVAVENLKESVGEHLLPALTSVATAASKFVGQMESGRGAGGDFVRTLKDIFGVVKTVGGALLDVGRAVLNSKVALIAFGAALTGLAISRTVSKVRDLASGFTGLTKVSKFTALTSAIGLVATAITLFSGNQRSAKDTAEDLTQALDDERSALKRLRDVDLDAADAKIRSQQSALALQVAEKNLTQLRKSGKATANDIKQAELNVSQARIQAKRDTRALKDIEGDAEQTRREFKSATDKAADALEAHAKALRREVFQTKDAKKAQDNLNRSLGEMKAATALRAAADIVLAMENVARAARNARAAVDSVSGAGGGRSGNAQTPGGFGGGAFRLAGPGSGRMPGIIPVPGWGPDHARRGGLGNVLGSFFATDTESKNRRFGRIQNQLSLVDLREQAGIYGAARADTERAKIAYFGTTSRPGFLGLRQRLELKGIARDTRLADRERATDLTEARRNKRYNKYVRAMDLIADKENAGTITPEQADKFRGALIGQALTSTGVFKDFGWTDKKGAFHRFGLTEHQRDLILADRKQLRDERAEVKADAAEAAAGEVSDAVQETNALLAQQLDLMRQARDDYQRALNVSQGQYDVFRKWISDVVSGEVGGRLGLAFQSPGFAGAGARY